jgi:hypothetical protein
VICCDTVILQVVVHDFPLRNPLWGVISRVNKSCQFNFLGVTLPSTLTGQSPCKSPKTNIITQPSLKIFFLSEGYPDANLIRDPCRGGNRIEVHIPNFPVPPHHQV